MWQRCENWVSFLAVEASKEWAFQLVFSSSFNIFWFFCLVYGIFDCLFKIGVILSMWYIQCGVIEKAVKLQSSNMDKGYQILSCLPRIEWNALRKPSKMDNSICTCWTFDQSKRLSYCLDRWWILWYQHGKHYSFAVHKNPMSDWTLNERFYHHLELYHLQMFHFAHLDFHFSGSN